jgi:hypothetical protein
MSRPVGRLLLQQAGTRASASRPESRNMRGRAAASHRVAVASIGLTLALRA